MTTVAGVESGRGAGPGEGVLCLVAAIRSRTRVDARLQPPQGDQRRRYNRQETELAQEAVAGGRHGLPLLAGEDVEINDMLTTTAKLTEVGESVGRREAHSQGLAMHQAARVVDCIRSRRSA